MEVLRPHVISEQRNERVLDSLYFGDDSFRNSYGRNNPIFEYWSYTLFVDLQNG